MQLPDGATIPATQGEVFVPLSVIPGTDIEWTEDLSVSLEDGEGYLLGNSSFGTLRIQDDDPVDIAADDLPEEVEDQEYNETNPGLYLLLNDDDDDEDGVIDGWESSPPGGDDEMVEAVLSFQSDEKIIGQSPNEQEAQVTLSLSSPRFRVWHNGSLLLGGPAGPMYIVLDHAALAGTMTVMVEFVPEPASPPGSPYVLDDLGVVTANLTLSANDVGPRAFDSLDILTLVGFPVQVDLDDPALDEAQERRYGTFVMINADNDNGSPVAEMWPETRDFEVASGDLYAQGGVENDLKEIHVIPKGAEFPVSVELTWSLAGIRVFRNSNKTQEIQSGDILTIGQQTSLYLEGTAISESLKSITFTARLMWPGTLPQTIDTLKAAIGPVLAFDRTQVVEGGPPGLRTPTSIISSSPQFHATNSAHDAAFWVQHYFYYHPVYELPAGQTWPLAYIQTVRNTGEPPHLTFAPSGNKFVWRFAVNEQPQNADATFLDGFQAAHFPYAYAPLSGITTPNEAGEQFLTTAMADTPERGFFGNGDPGDSSVVFDFGSEYRSHLVLPLQGGVYYPLGYVTWTVRYAGTLTSGPAGFAFAPVAGNNKVEAGDFVASSLKPSYTHYLRSILYYDLIPWL